LNACGESNQRASRWMTSSVNAIRWPWGAGF